MKQNTDKSKMPLNYYSQAMTTALYSKEFSFYEAQSEWCLNKKGNKSKYLSISKTNGELTVKTDPKRTFDYECFGLIGVIELYSSPVIIIAKNAEIVASIGTDKIYKITEIETVRCSSSEETSIDQKCLRSLKQYLSIPGFYFSYTYDLCRSVQAREEGQLTDLWCFNSFAQKKIAELVDAKEIEATFLFPIIHGSIVSFSLRIQNQMSLSVVLITRKHCKRQGARYHTRGVDSSGCVSNYMETEQIVFLDGNVFSFVQLRGSIPLYWAQTVNLRYKPSLLVFKEQLGTALERHFSAIRRYNSSLSILDLVDQKGYEKPLSREFSYQCRLNKEDYIQVDFHKESKDGLIEAKLVSAVSSPLSSQEYFHKQNGSQIKTQKGVIRTNCVDCLDRTNVAQSIIAFEQLKRMLKECDVLFESTEESTKKKMVSSFKQAWIENGNTISIQYSGTGALKTGYKATGHHKLKSNLKDLVHSIVRYWKANFSDYLKQEGADLFLGECVVQHKVSPFLLQRKCSLSLFLFILFVLFVFVRFDVFYMLCFLKILLPSVLEKGVFYARYPRLKRSFAFIPAEILKDDPHRKVSAK